MKQKNELYLLHDARLTKLEDMQHKSDIKLNQIGSAVEHIKVRIDNGISLTVTKIWETLNKDVIPSVKDSKFWVGWMKKAMASVFIVGVCKVVWDKVGF